ncbi:hypothetical protein CAPTEDRAFT_214337 [Capitella teleta]|uniref:Uncharacterized protein n=1 Tax=Capitella teleta TaxID=283909 RepID=R7U767_CAPTE|nr:hypothetical protein CAPTEDRAFT_214337 [Capitella teleta]|eukprot:ELU01819.1 hypothetical protein CAPTEDRAFT_214337 [Capitella teleta]
MRANQFSGRLETGVVMLKKSDHHTKHLDSARIEVITIDTDSSSETESLPSTQHKNETETQHWTDLLHAGDLDEFQKQIKTTPALWYEDNDGNTPAHLIAVTGFGQCIRVKRLQKKLGSDDSIPRHKSNQLLNTFLGFAKKLGLPLFQKNRSGDTPLHLAIENAQTEVAMTLTLYANKDDLAITNRTGQTAFHLALEHEARPIAFSILYRNSCEDLLLEEQLKWMDTIMDTPEAILNRTQPLSSNTKEQTDKPETQLASAVHQSLSPQPPETHLKTE